MSTAPTAPRRRTASSPRVLAHLTTVEARLFLRQPSGWFFSLLFPAVLLLGLGLFMPWADLPYDDRDPILSQINGITGYTPTVLALAIATIAYTALPTMIVTYREKGVLRRLATTPLPASRLLMAQLLVMVATLVAAVLLATGIGFLVLDVAPPADLAAVVLAVVLGAGASLGVGCLIAARVPAVSGATGIGMTVYFVSLFFAGVWMPLQFMPTVVQTISAYTPLGAASQAIAAGWYGQPFPALELVVLAVWTAVLVPLAARLFRWT